jgi:hypothetical protein
MVIAEIEKLEISTTHEREWRETAENLRILGSTCLEIAEQMEKRLAEIKPKSQPRKSR